MKKTMTVITCDLCGHISYGDTVEKRKWALVDERMPNARQVPFPDYLDLCPSCYDGLVKYLSSRRSKRFNKNQMTFDNDFPEFVTEEKSGDYFDVLSKADPEPWRK